MTEAIGSILIADDDETFRESTCRLLRREGFLCHGAGDAEEGLEILQDRRFDLLIADIRMPANPDLRLVQAARELDGQMHVIVVTGYPSMQTAIRGIDLAVAAYMTKPIDFDELLGQAKTAVRRSQNRRALAAVRERLQSCLGDLETAEALPRSDSSDESGLLGTIRTLAACLSELLRLSQSTKGPNNLCELLDCPQQPVHRQAIVHTIEVLKRTKDTFKSKVLADLRAKLESLLDSGAKSC